MRSRLNTFTFTFVVAILFLAVDRSLFICAAGNFTEYSSSNVKSSSLRQMGKKEMYGEKKQGKQNGSAKKS